MTPTLPSRGAVVLLDLLAVLQVVWANRADNHDLAVPATLLALATLLIAVLLAVREGFEVRCVAVVAAAAQLLIGLLTVTLGLPGQAPHPDDTLALVTVLAGGGSIGLIVWDWGLRTRRRTPAPSSAPYAR